MKVPETEQRGVLMRQPVQELIERYQKNLYAAAFNICKNQMDAEDVVQETFVQYYTTKKEFESEQHIRVWKPFLFLIPSPEICLKKS